MTDAETESGGRRRAVAVRVLLVTVSTGLMWLIGELILIPFPVPTGFRTPPVDENAPILHLAPNRNFVYSKGWNFSTVNRGVTNAQGYVSPFDYERNGPPLVAVIGDSFVEAAMVPHEETLQGRLHRCLNPGARAYGFGISDSPLSQYLPLAQWVRDRFRPDVVVFVVVGNDFEESFAQVEVVPGRHHFVLGEDDVPELVRYDYQPSTLRRIARRSRVLRYVSDNLGALGLITNRVIPSLDDGEYVGHVKAQSTPERLSLASRAIDEFLSRAPAVTGLDPDRIIIVVDAPRPHLYRPAALESAQTSYFVQVRNQLIQRGEERGFEVVDLQPIFIDEYERTAVRFEFPTDGHWDSNGHRVAAESLFRIDPIRELTVSGVGCSGS